jgi:hypothetical protein
MSDALPGRHYCEEHQGNHSHYASENCDLCKALATIHKMDTDRRYVYVVSHRRHAGDDTPLHTASSEAAAIVWMQVEHLDPGAETEGYYCLCRDRVDAPQSDVGTELLGFYSLLGQPLEDQPDIADPKDVALREAKLDAEKAKAERNKQEKEYVELHRLKSEIARLQALVRESTQFGMNVAAGLPEGHSGDHLRAKARLLALRAEVGDQAAGRIVRRKFTASIAIPASFSMALFEGWSAAELRGLGCALPPTIPDCATLRGGMFEHVRLDIGFAPPSSVSDQAAHGPASSVSDQVAGHTHPAASEGSHHDAPPAP